MTQSARSGPFASPRSKRKEGYCSVSTSRNGCFQLPREEYAKVRAAWLKGVQFVDTVTFHGSPITIKLVDVDSVEDCLPDALEAAKQEELEDNLLDG